MRSCVSLLDVCRAQRQEISSLRQALAETQDVMLKGKQTYNQVVHTKDLQIAQVGVLYAQTCIHASGVCWSRLSRLEGCFIVTRLGKYRPTPVGHCQFVLAAAMFPLHCTPVPLVC